VGRSSVVVLALAACLAGSASAAAAGSPKDPTLHRVAADVALAKTLLLGKRDLPAGFRDAGPDTSGNGSDDVCKGVVEPDLHRLVMQADVTSHDFQLTDAATGFTQVSTEATLFRSAREATASMAWFTSLPKSKLQTCFEAAFRAGLPKAAKTQGFRLQVTRRTISDLHLGIWEMGLRFPEERRLDPGRLRHRELPPRPRARDADGGQRRRRARPEAHAHGLRDDHDAPLSRLGVM
jgi:hypothetical protein